MGLYFWIVELSLIVSDDDTTGVLMYNVRDFFCTELRVCLRVDCTHAAIDHYGDVNFDVFRFAVRKLSDFIGNSVADDFFIHSLSPPLVYSKGDFHAAGFQDARIPRPTVIRSSPKDAAPDEGFFLGTLRRSSISIGQLK